MAIYDIYSRRHKTGPDVFQYDDLPEQFRVQVVYIWRQAIHDDGDRYAKTYWSEMADTLAKELGQFQLVDKRGLTGWGQCVEFLTVAPTDEALTLIEMSFRHLSEYFKRHLYSERLQPSNEAILELNARFRLHGIGYEFVDDRIVRIDSQYMHAASVKPGLMLLKDNKFRGPEKEFLQAHEHFRKGKYEDAVAWALKSFESTMKTICEARKIPYAAKDTAKPLIDKMFAEEVVPEYLQSEFSGIRSVLESGLPTLSNKSGRHGQGANPRDIPGHFAAYALHMAASNIVFLVECHKS